MKNVVKLAKFFDKELSSNIRDVLVTKYQSGEYGLYGKYLVKPTTTGWYKVTVLKNHDVHEFTSLKNAVTWCTLDNASMVSQAARLYRLDLKLSSLQVDMLVHNRKYRSADNPNAKVIYATKIQEDVFQKREVVNEINSFIHRSMLVQSKNFSNKRT
jgi:hypothetical protein